MKINIGISIADMQYIAVVNPALGNGARLNIYYH